jgi:hypothetical protein
LPSDAHGEHWWLAANDEVTIKSFAPEGTLLKVTDYGTNAVLRNWAGEPVCLIRERNAVSLGWRWIRLPNLNQDFGG